MEGMFEYKPQGDIVGRHHISQGAQSILSENNYIKMAHDYLVILLFDNPSIYLDKIMTRSKIML